MFQVILVDDEKLALDTMSALIDWKLYNAELMATCLSGVEALEVIVNRRPDIVITDMKMPVMNGIELIRNVRDKGFDTEFIVLTGYDEFAFAKQVMKENVKHYILKPCNEDEVIEALKKTIEDINQKRVYLQVSQAQRLAEQELLKHNVLLALQNQSTNQDCFAQRQTGNYISKYMNHFPYLLWVSFEYGDDITSLDDSIGCFWGICNDDIVFSSLALCINGFLGGFFLSKESVMPNALITQLQKSLYSCVKRLLPISANTIISPFDVCEDITKSCGVFVGYFYETDKSFRYQSCNHLPRLQDAETMRNRLETFIDNGDETGMREIIFELFCNDDLSFSIAVCTRLLMKKLATEQIDRGLVTKMLHAVYENTDKEQLVVHVTELFSQLIVKKNETENFVDKIVQYIEENLHDSSITLKRVAKEIVFLNEDYVGKAFIKKIGEPFISYLNRKRIERAKFLLGMVVADKMYMVAEQVGYGDNPRYFSKLFKKYTGYTPKEYQQLGK